MGETVGPRLEFSIGHTLPVLLHGNGIRCAPRLLFDQAMEALVRLHATRRLSPRHHRVASFDLGHERQGTDRATGIVCQRLEQTHKMLLHPCDPIRRQQGIFIFEIPAQPLFRFRHLDTQIELPALLRDDKRRPGREAGLGNRRLRDIPTHVEFGEERKRLECE